MPETIEYITSRLFNKLYANEKIYQKRDDSFNYAKKEFPDLFEWENRHIKLDNEQHCQNYGKVLLQNIKLIYFQIDFANIKVEKKGEKMGNFLKQIN